MASILDRYGIKEVCDFTFYTIDDSTGKPSAPALYLDTLKVSTIEQTADTVDAKGGKGNVTLLSWDTNKEINVTLEDALFSAKSLAIMFGNGTLKSYNDSNSYIMKSETFTATATTLPVQGTSSSGWNHRFEGPTGYLYEKRNPKFYNAYGSAVSTLVVGDTYFCSYDIKVEGSVVDVSANSFPGTYYCVGDTFARNSKSGRDEFFQFIIPKAKVQSSNTITLQAEGDPSTFNMSLKVMRPDDGVMMKLVKYDAVDGDAPEAESSKAELNHNHVLTQATATLLGSAEVTGTGTAEILVTGLTSSATITGGSSSIATCVAGAGKITVTGVGAGFTTYSVSDTGAGITGVVDIKVNPAG